MLYSTLTERTLDYCFETVHGGGRLAVATNMWILYLGDLIDENCFYNCVGESEKALLVSVSTKGITVDHENWIEQHRTKDSYFFHDFIHSCLDTISL